MNTSFPSNLATNEAMPFENYIPHQELPQKNYRLIAQLVAAFAAHVLTQVLFPNYMLALTTLCVSVLLTRLVIKGLRPYNSLIKKQSKLPIITLLASVALCYTHTATGNGTAILLNAMTGILIGLDSKSTQRR